jgi:hypothetical protein
MHRISLDHYDQANQLKAIRAEGNLGVANFSACQDVLRRVDKTFVAFFRRVRAGEPKVSASGARSRAWSLLTAAQRSEVRGRGSSEAASRSTAAPV